MPNESVPFTRAESPLLETAIGFLGHVVALGATDAPEAAYLADAAGRIAGAPVESLEGAFLAEDGSPIGRIAAALHLSAAEAAVVALVLAVDADPMAGRAIAYLQAPVGGSRPTLGLLARVFGRLDPNVRDPIALAAGRPVQAGLLRLTEGGPLPERAVRLADGMSACLAGARPHWPGLRRIGGVAKPDWPASLAGALGSVAEGLRRQPGTLLVMRGVSAGDREEIAARIAAECGAAAAHFDLDGTEGTGLGAWLTGVGAMPAFHADMAPGVTCTLPELPGYAGPVLAFLGPEGAIGQRERAQTEWTLPLPEPEERRALWYRSLGDDDLSRMLATEHLQSAGRIAEVCHYARTQAALEGKERADLGALRSAIWVSDGGGLGALAQPVRDTIPDDAMITTAALRQELDYLLARCRAREKLTEGFGTALQARYKVGVRALMAGPSGTGKTLAASWLAGKLMLPLYRVDLAAVSSKYIGETEKNLSALLAKAEELDLVLLFDEADSLFGKRTDISDSNDRFANAQTNYLLQRIETFTGIVLLTSNAKNRFDEAFTRRIDAIVDFNQPDVEERYALWLAHLGQGHALAAADLGRLAAYADIAGGHIRNVVLLAAVLARQSGDAVGYAHVLRGLRSEYRKLGLTVPTELTRAEGGP